MIYFSVKRCGSNILSGSRFCRPRTVSAENPGKKKNSHARLLQNLKTHNAESSLLSEISIKETLLFII